MMTQEKLPEGYVAHLPPPKPRMHSAADFYPPRYIPPSLSASGYEQHERTCRHCGAVKITILDRGADAYRRAWRKAEDAEQVETFVALVCGARVG